MTLYFLSSSTHWSTYTTTHMIQNVRHLQAYKIKSFLNKMHLLAFPSAQYLGLCNGNTKLLSHFLIQTFRAANKCNQILLKDAIPIFEFVRNLLLLLQVSHQSHNEAQERHKILLADNILLCTNCKRTVDKDRLNNHKYICFTFLSEKGFSLQHE